MYRFLKYIKSLGLLKGRLQREEDLQHIEGYSIVNVWNGGDQYFLYVENDTGNSLTIGVDFSWLNDVKIYTESFRFWSQPEATALSKFEIARVKTRLVRYFSAWGGNVEFDDAMIRSLTEIKEDLNRKGIAYTEVDGFVIYKDENIE